MHTKVHTSGHKIISFYEVTIAALKRTATSFAAWLTEARWVWTVCLRMLPDSVATAIWTQALLHANHSATEPPSYVYGTYFILETQAQILT